MTSSRPWYLRRVNGAVGLFLISVAFILAVMAQIYTPYSPIALDFEAYLAAPSADHWFGTDQFGRDVFSRLMSASWVSLSVSFYVVAFAMLLGVPIGALAGYCGNWVDRVVMSVTDAFMALPSLLLALAIMSAIGPGKWGVVLALGLAYTPSVIRVVRGSVLSIREKEYVDASRVMGNSELYTVIRHVIPNCVGPLIVLGTVFFALSILSESALSFLGLGVPPPYPSWGGMLSDARIYFSIAPWLVIFPGLAITVTLLGINLFGDALRDRYDPRMSGL
ncbi:ABC transporter permease [Kordiimonas pumila]|uniref:ABC transporter permease n=1 Tax=Kordiimonas pumila TaxID=2161677 RepID=A0ABV7D3X2_9PROT|nr:ABC transporter permease [Kordiimonas pumila]